MAAALEKKLRRDAWEAPLSAELREKFYFAIESLEFPEGTALAAKEPYSLAAQAVAPLVRSAAVNAVGDGVMADTLASLAATAVMQGADKDTITALGSLACGFRANALKAAAQQTKDEALRLAREKFEAAERRENAAKAALGDTKLNDADKLAKMKEIFG